jgi:hypothetical protein
LRTELGQQNGIYQIATSRMLFVHTARFAVVRHRSRVRPAIRHLWWSLANSRAFLTRAHPDKSKLLPAEDLPKLGLERMLAISREQLSSAAVR